MRNISMTGKKEINFENNENRSSGVQSKKAEIAFSLDRLLKLILPIRTLEPLPSDFKKSL